MEDWIHEACLISAVTSGPTKPTKDSKEKGKTDMTKIKCYKCGEMGHFAWNCPKPLENANIAQESE